MKKLYLNGNYLVSYDDRCSGSRVYTALRRNEDFIPDFPDSIDLKITNKCNNNCAYCHENSNANGKSFNLERTIAALSDLPKHTEVAIGGGNILECFDDFLKLCYHFSEKGIFPRVTINYRDLEKFLTLYQKIDFGLIKNLVVGISIETYEEYLNSISLIRFSNINHFCTDFVFHIIVGIFPYNCLENIVNDTKSDIFNRFKILILGFKQFGRAKDMEIKDLDNWRSSISKLFYNRRCKRFNHFSREETIIGFDNLAVEQLNIKDLLLASEWNSYYMGQDFSHTMYVDAVNEEFAPTSRSPYNERCSWDSISILDYFKKNRKSWS